jgi:DNA-binding SARP family transcriptional activator
MTASSDYRLRLQLFGAPRLAQAGRPVHLPRRKALGLLAYMAFGKREVHRDTLAVLLWPDHDDSHARGSLRRLLSEIRKILGPDLLPAVEDRVGPMDLGRIWVDIEEFQALMARFRLNQRLGAERDSGERPGARRAGTSMDETSRVLLRRAVDLYRGDFLDGFTLAECGQFSDWQFLQGEYLRRELCTALEHLVGISEREGEWA